MVEWNGTERREYCAVHCRVVADIGKTVPRWVFLSSISTIITVSIIFAGWHVSTLSRFDEEYRNEVKLFYKATNKNKELLIRFGVIQEDVLMEIKELKEHTKNGNGSRR